MFERFTDRARRVILLAQEHGHQLGHRLIGPEHLLVGLRHENEGIAALALQKLGVTTAGLTGQLEKIAGRAEPGPGDLPFTTNAKKALELSLREALKLGHNYIGTEHILLAVLQLDQSDGAGVAAMLENLGVNKAELRGAVLHALTGEKPVIHTKDGLAPIPASQMPEPPFKMKWAVHLSSGGPYLTKVAVKLLSNVHFEQLAGFEERSLPNGYDPRPKIAEMAQAILDRTALAAELGDLGCDITWQ